MRIIDADMLSDVIVNEIEEAMAAGEDENKETINTFKFVLHELDKRAFVIPVP